MHYSASTIILKRLVREISNNQNAKHLISHSESLRAMERVIFCQIEASEGETFYSTKNENNLSKHTYNTNNCGGGEGGGKRLEGEERVLVLVVLVHAALIFRAYLAWAGMCC